MSAPLLILAVTISICVLLWILLLPGKGYLWHLMNAHRVSEKILIEHALKHLFDFEYQNTDSTIEKLSESMGTSVHKSQKILQELKSHDLVLTDDDKNIHLTPGGRDYALKVIRVHRLWERYLADETGYKEEEWHREADRREHFTPSDYVNILDARLGHPQYDPHGDPIPSLSGRIAPKRGVPITSLKTGDTALIVHIEDEPELIFAQLTAEGLHPGMSLKILDISSDSISFITDIDEHILAGVIAKNIFAVPSAREEKDFRDTEPLSVLTSGDEGKVKYIAQNCRGVERRRLMDMGVVPGTVIKAEFPGSSGKLMAYRIRGALIAIREEQAKKIRIKRIRM